MRGIHIHRPRKRERERELYYINTRYMGDECFFCETVFHALPFLSIASHSAGHISNETALLLPLLQRQRLPLPFDRLNALICSCQNRSQKTLGDRKKEKKKKRTTNNLKVLNKYICFGINCNPYFHCLNFFHIELLVRSRSFALYFYLKFLLFFLLSSTVICLFVLNLFLILFLFVFKQKCILFDFQYIF